MQVDHARWKAVEKRPAEDVHPARQHNQIRLTATHPFRQIAIVALAAATALAVLLKWKVEGRNLRLLRPHQTIRCPTIGDDQHDLGVQITFVHRIHQRLQICACA